MDTLQVIETKVCFHDGTLKSEILWSSLPFPLPAPFFSTDGPGNYLSRKDKYILLASFVVKM
jgi:hypothetical protein